MGIISRQKMSADFIHEITDFMEDNGVGCETFQLGETVFIRAGFRAGGEDRSLLILPAGISARTVDEARLDHERRQAAIRTAGNAVTLAEDRWRSQTRLYRARLLAHAGKFRRISARDCEAVRTDRMSANLFLAENHSYGPAACRHCYSLVEKKSGETVADVLKYAAGFSDNANDRLVRVTRVNGERTETFNVMAQDFGTFELKDGDIVNVMPNIGRNRNIVTIRGAVWHPGSYAITDSVSSLRQLIEFAGGLREEAFMDRGNIIRLDEKRDTISLYFNVEKVMAGAQDIPLCTEDTVRIFSTADMMVRTEIETRGHLNNPSVLPFRPGMTLGDAILLSGGFAVGASKTNIDIARRNILDNSQRSDTISVVYNFNIVDDPAALDFELKAFDIISVRPSPSYKPQQGITVNGEVVFPGYYVIESNVVHLSEVIARTGGCTPDAYLEGATVERLLSDEEYDRAVQAARLAMREEGVDSSMIEIPDRDDRYKIGINMVAALDKPGSYNDIVLQNGDIVNIPKLNNTVKISGAVLYPNTVVYDPSISVNQYIKMAGGYVKGAIKGGKYIVFMNGTASTRGNKNFKPMPGCEIIVPQKDLSQRQRISAAEIVSIASSTTSIATMVISMVNLLK